MAQAVSLWSLTAEARVRVRVSPCGICGTPCAIPPSNRNGIGHSASDGRIIESEIMWKKPVIACFKAHAQHVCEGT
jgi:hypothetical protein